MDPQSAYPPRPLVVFLINSVGSFWEQEEDEEEEEEEEDEEEELEEEL